MPQTLLTFGDSNTHGAVPIHTADVRERFKPDQRWPGVVRPALGCTLIEEGLPGRTCASPDPDMGAFMDGRLGLSIALQSHGPIDMLIVMLGTNDVKARFNLSPGQITAHMAGLLDFALSPDIQARHNGFEILLICPPPVCETGLLVEEFFCGTAKSHALGPLYADLAATRGIYFLDAGLVISCSTIDGIHFDASGHAVLGDKIAALLTNLQKEKF